MLHLSSPLATLLHLYSFSSPPCTHTENAWILTREKLAPGTVLQKAYGVLDKFKLSRTFFVKTDQNSCEIAEAAENTSENSAASPNKTKPQKQKAGQKKGGDQSSGREEEVKEEASPAAVPAVVAPAAVAAAIESKKPIVAVPVPEVIADQKVVAEQKVSALVVEQKQPIVPAAVPAIAAAPIVADHKVTQPIVADHVVVPQQSVVSDVKAVPTIV